MKPMSNHLISWFAAFSLLVLGTDAHAIDNGVSAKHKKAQNFHRTVKPHAPIFMDYQLPQTIEANQPIAIDISIVSGRSSEDMRIHLRTGEGLQTTDVLTRSFSTQQTGQKNAFSLTVQAAEDGRYRLYVTASLINGDTTQSRSFIIPVNIGKQISAPKLKAMGVIVEDEVGEKIISMPATETP